MKLKNRIKILKISKMIKNLKNKTYKIYIFSIMQNMCHLNPEFKIPDQGSCSRFVFIYLSILWQVLFFKT